MTNNLKNSSSWSQLAFFLVVFGGCYIFFTLISGLIVELSGISGEIGAGTWREDPRAVEIMKGIQAIASIGIFFLPGWIFARRAFRDRPLYQLGLRPAVRSSLYLLAIVLLLVAVPLEIWTGELNKHIPMPHWMNQLQQENDAQIDTFLKVRTAIDPVYNILLLAALPAFCEELCFRGALQRILIGICKAPWAGILVTAILFSAFHLQFQGFIPRVLLGVLLGAACWYSGSLWPSMLAHFFFNGIQVAAAMYSPSAVEKNPTMPFYGALLSIVIIVGLLYRMKKQSPITYAGVYSS